MDKSSLRGRLPRLSCSFTILVCIPPSPAFVAGFTFLRRFHSGVRKYVLLSHYIIVFFIRSSPNLCAAREDDGESKQRRRRRKVKSVVKERRRKVKLVVKGR
nr:hypothetical protein Itr_chr10CG13270 [Ipomoea trifida]